MLFHITYDFSSHERDSAQKRFKETGTPPPDGVTMHGSDLLAFCLNVCAEADSRPT